MAGKNLFNSVQVSRPKKNVFDLSHDVKLSMNMGRLVPIMCTEIVPGDKFNISCEAMIRVAPLVAPMMHRVDSTIHYFFVPNRLVWPGWEDFITNTPDGDGNLPAFPTIEVGDSIYSELADYFGIPPATVVEDERISAIPFAAYQMIYDEYYRDQNLQESVQDQLGLAGRGYLVDGDNNIAASLLLGIKNRAWEHDYFTAALPFAQKGSAVALPLGDVTLKDTGDWPPIVDGVPHMVREDGTFINGDLVMHGAAGQPYLHNASAGPGYLAYDPAGTLEVGATTINDLRRAFRLQEWLEKAARGGSRYIEMIRSMFGVISSDKRLQRPEYITGVKAPVQISEVLNTTGTTELPQGNMAGHGIGLIQGKYGNYYAEEHGYIIGIMSVMPKTAYQQGIPKHFLKTSDAFQYYWEQFAHIGEQEVQNREVYAYQGDALGDQTFGYVPRYAEYKFEQNRVAGEFRTTLNHWHMGRIFTAPPALNSQFVTADPTHRVFAVTDTTEDKLYCHVYNKVRAVRPMPKFGTPTY